MARYVVDRIIAMFLTLFIIMSLSFFVIRLMPQNIFENPELPAEVIKMLEDKMHLNDPLYVQYYSYLKGIVADGDLGVSVKIRPNMPDFELIKSRVPITMLVNVLSLFISLPLGIIAGTLAALYKNKAIDNIISVLIVICISVPSFVFASLLQYALTHVFPVFPTLYNPGAKTLAQVLHSVALPVIALALGPIATIARYLRGELIETMGSEFLLLARTKGLTQRQAITRHAFRNSCVPLANIIISMFAGIMGGSMVIESIFGIPGMGGMLVKSINAGDHPLTIALLVFYSFISLVTVLITDLSYGILDPRIRMGSKK